MNSAVNLPERSEAEPVWLTVARLGAGFHRMEQMSRELVELDGVRRDILSIQVLIRRDVAAGVLQTALCMKERETVAARAADLHAVEDVESTSPQPDEWAGRLVRWADQFGRDLFKLPTLLLPSSRKQSGERRDSRDDHPQRDE
jgi:hypothetical protein